MGYAVRMTLPLVMVPTDDPWAFPTASRFALADGSVIRVYSFTRQTEAARAARLSRLAAPD